MVSVAGHEAVVPACRGRYDSQEVGGDELKPPRDLDLAGIVEIWLRGARCLPPPPWQLPESPM